MPSHKFLFQQTVWHQKKYAANNVVKSEGMQFFASIAITYLMLNIIGEMNLLYQISFEKPLLRAF